MDQETLTVVARVLATLLVGGVIGPEVEEFRIAPAGD